MKRIVSCLIISFLFLVTIAKASVNQDILKAKLETLLKANVESNKYLESRFRFLRIEGASTLQEKGKYIFKAPDDLTIINERDTLRIDSKNWERKTVDGKREKGKTRSSYVLKQTLNLISLASKGNLDDIEKSYDMMVEGDKKGSYHIVLKPHASLAKKYVKEITIRFNENAKLERLGIIESSGSETIYNFFY